MSDVYIAFGTLLSLGIVFPGLLMACWLLFPNLVGRAEERIARTPGRSFGLGLTLTVVLLLPVLILTSIAVPFTNFLAALLVGAAFTLSIAGAAGLVAWMAGRLRENSQDGLSPSAAYLRAAIALELAAAFPLIGWFLFIPLCVITSFGAAAFALLHWQPRVDVQTREPRIVVRAAGANDVS